MTKKKSSLDEDTFWRRLSETCEIIHDLLYVQNDQTAALKNLPKLRDYIGKMGQNHGSIIGEEACALEAELVEDYVKAISFRRHEVKMIKRLHKTITDEQRIDGIDSLLLRRRQEIDITFREKLIRRLRSKVETGRRS